MRWVALAVVLSACGDDAPGGPRPLVPDPAVETGCITGIPTTARAKLVACNEELVAGRLASGRIGDFVLENDRVRVIVRGPGEGYLLHGSAGGNLVDAARWGGEDLIKEIEPLVDLATGGFDELAITEAGDSGPAEIVVRGRATPLDLVSGALVREVPDVVIEHHYRLAAGATEVELETKIYGDGEHELFDGVFLGGRAPTWVPGHDFLATAGTSTSYGLAYAKTRPQLIDLAGIRLVQGPSISTAKSATRWLVIGDGSVASVTERAWALRDVATSEFTGTSEPGVDLVIAGGGSPITVARTGADGAYRVALPEGGNYTVHAEARGRDIGPEVPLGGAIAAGGSGTLAIAVRDDHGLAIPARVQIARTGEDPRLEYVGASGDAVFPVEPGTWWVSVSRGLEYEAFVASAVTIADKQTTTLPVTLARSVDTTGWIALDTHLHSELSTDSTLPIDDRLRAVAAEGIEVPVSSDHDIAVDYTPIIAELGLDGVMASLPGSETSSLVWGHINAFPLAVDPARTGGGSPRWNGKTPGQIFAELHGASPTARIVQANHPRHGSTSLFDAIDLDPKTLVARRDPTALGLPAGADLSDLSFDAMEVANALADEDFEEVFADFLAMVLAGHPAAATGSSDSHDASAFAGEARTFVYVGSDDPTTVDPQTIVDAIRARHVVVGTCAFVTATIGTAMPGDSVDLAGLSQVVLHIHVQAPSWQPLARISIYQGTQALQTIDLDPMATTPVRFDADVTLAVPSTSTFWIVRVDPAGPGDPVLESSMPSFTNPIFGTR